MCHTYILYLFFTFGNAFPNMSRPNTALFWFLDPTATTSMTWWSTSTKWHTDPSFPTPCPVPSISKCLSQCRIFFINGPVSLAIRCYFFFLFFFFTTVHVCDVSFLIRQQSYCSVFRNESIRALDDPWQSWKGKTSNFWVKCWSGLKWNETDHWYWFLFFKWSYMCIYCTCQ